MTTPFLAWLVQQYDLEVESFGNDPARLLPEERKDYFRWNAFAAEDELHEAAQEIAWKPWAVSEHFNREKFMREMVDVMFFIGNIMLMAAETDESGNPLIGMLANEYWQMYREKVQINADRMASKTYAG